eukprot:CAMPEP_0174887234 /NCGR_PEP_ID=MMETSP0167-20121228/2492_1 /TAXON_ID=38298 /ORGANISM="Rhodella maculata, Strain CCMP736" /LENGTH=61 /DNA_ID=CAMNT_0016123629 /DNA_START=493 /DNA_END=675 /DNA_ORIENTATION=-
MLSTYGEGTIPFGPAELWRGCGGDHEDEGDEMRFGAAELSGDERGGDERSARMNGADAARI